MQVFSQVLVGLVPFGRASEASIHALVSLWNKKGKANAAASELLRALKWAQELVRERMWGDRNPDLLHRHLILSHPAVKSLTYPPRVVGGRIWFGFPGKRPMPGSWGGGWE